MRYFRQQSLGLMSLIAMPHQSFALLHKCRRRHSSMIGIKSKFAVAVIAIYEAKGNSGTQGSAVSIKFLVQIANVILCNDFALFLSTTKCQFKQINSIHTVCTQAHTFTPIIHKHTHGTHRHTYIHFLSPEQIHIRNWLFSNIDKGNVKGIAGNRWG